MAELTAHTSLAGLERARLDPVFGRLRDLRVWVVGDIMLDEYAIGDTDRISPEAPVPVIRVQRSEDRLGGAANVARQVAALGAHASLAGAIGADPEGERILKQCGDAGIDTRAVRRVAARRTTRKLRGLARHQQLVRLDWEDTAPCQADDVRWMLGQLHAGPVPDVIVASDYAKGVLTPALFAGLVEAATGAAAHIVVGPKQPDFCSYRGASVITPNIRELEAATGRTFDPADTAALAAAAQSLAADLGVDALAVTRAEHGILVAPARGRCRAIAAHAQVLSDPTGAGDIVLAVLAATLAAGATLIEAASLANVAAGISIARIGTVSVTPEEILAATERAGTRRVLGRAELVRQVEDWRASGKRIALTNGCFDLLHAGHLALLHEAARCGDALIVAINSDASVQRLKGPGRPLVGERERAAMLAALGCVDAVTVFDEDTPLELLEAVRPDVLVKGQDYGIDEVVGRDLVESGGGRVVLVPLLPGKSTTALLDRIASHRPTR